MQLTPTTTMGDDTLPLKGRCRSLLIVSRANVITLKIGEVVFCAGGCLRTDKKASAGGRLEMRIACTGFLSEQAGSMAAAKAMLLRTLVERDLEGDFFSQPSFVDPRTREGGRRGLRFLPTINQISDAPHRKLRRVPFVG